MTKRAKTIRPAGKQEKTGLIVWGKMDYLV
jgi:hypothetical protein